MKGGICENIEAAEVLLLVYLFVGVGGVLGSLFRYLVSEMAINIWNPGFPFGTLIINLTGAFLLGWVTSRLITPGKFDHAILTAFSTGVIGSYTTFSTFCLETVRLLDSRAYFTGILYITLSLTGGLLLVHLGMQTGSRAVKSEREEV